MKNMLLILAIVMAVAATGIALLYWGNFVDCQRDGLTNALFVILPLSGCGTSALYFKEYHRRLKDTNLP